MNYQKRTQTKPISNRHSKQQSAEDSENFDGSAFDKQVQFAKILVFLLIGCWNFYEDLFG
jgi:hypothetical protein